MLRKALLGAALAAAVAGVSAHTESHETIKLKVAAEGFEPEVLVLENVPVGAMETVVTDAGNEALVTRFDDRFEIELHGELIVVEIPAFSGLELGFLGDGPSVRHRVVIGDSDHEWVSDGHDVALDSLELLEKLDLEGIELDASDDGARVMVIHREIHKEDSSQD